MNVRVGTCGWSYDDWGGPFYPPGMSAGDYLQVYANTAANPNPGRKRLWRNRNYRRLKQCHNYYSP